MKKSTFLTLLILIICIISMSMLFIACNNSSKSPIIGKFYTDEIVGGYTYEFLNDHTVIENGSIMSECKWQYIKESKFYAIVHEPTNIYIDRFVMINKNTIEKLSHSSDRPNTKYIRIS